MPDDARDAEIARAAAGDRRAFAALFARYAPMVHGVVLAHARPEDADDLVQDVFETALTKLSTLREAGAVGAWLARIARNRAVGSHRARRPEVRLDDDEAGADGAEVARARADDAASPSRRVEAARVLDAIRALPEAYRETLVLRLVEGMTGPEIAEQVGMTADSVRVNLHRGMKLLRARLGIDAEGES